MAQKDKVRPAPQSQMPDTLTDEEMARLMPDTLTDEQMAQLSGVSLGASEAATTGAAGRFIQGVGEEWPIGEALSHPIDTAKQMLMGLGSAVFQDPRTGSAGIGRMLTGPLERGGEKISEGDVAGGLGNITAGAIPWVTGGAVPAWLRARRLAKGKQWSALEQKGTLPETALRARESVRQQKNIGTEEIEQGSAAIQAPLEAGIQTAAEARTQLQRQMAQQLRQETMLKHGKKMTLREAQLELEKATDIRKREMAEQVIKQTAAEVDKTAPEFGKAVSIIERSDRAGDIRKANYKAMGDVATTHYNKWREVLNDPLNSKPVVIKTAPQQGAGMGQDLFSGFDMGATPTTQTVMMNSPLFEWTQIKKELTPYYEMASQTAQGATPTFTKIMNTPDVVPIAIAETYLSELKAVIRTQFPQDKSTARGLNKLVMSKLFPEKGDDIIAKATKDLVNGDVGYDALQSGRAASKLQHTYHDSTIAKGVASRVESGEGLSTIAQNPVETRAYIRIYGEPGVNTFRRQTFDELLAPSVDPVTGAFDNARWASAWTSIPDESKSMIYSDRQIALGNTLMQPNVAVDQLMQQYKEQVWGLKKEALDIEKTSQQRTADIQKMRTMEQTLQDQLKTLTEQRKLARGRERIEKGALRRDVQDQLAKIRIDMAHERSSLNNQIAAQQSSALKRKIALGMVTGALGAYGAARVYNNMKAVFGSP